MTSKNRILITSSCQDVFPVKSDSETYRYDNHRKSSEFSAWETEGTGDKTGEDSLLADASDWFSFDVSDVCSENSSVVVKEEDVGSRAPRKIQIFLGVAT